MVSTAEAAEAGKPRAAGYRRSAGSPRGEARRRELLDLVTEELAVNGLVDFSLRRAARAAGTTHKVLLYYFDGPDDLLAQAVVKLRDRRVLNALEAAQQAQPQTLAARVLAIWPVLMGTERRVLAQAVGLMLYDADRYAALGASAAEQYMPALRSICPPDWPEQRKSEVAEMVMASLQGLVITMLMSGDSARAEAGLAALGRALEREESRPE